MTFDEYSSLPNKKWYEVTAQGYFEAGAASRDAEVAELREYILFAHVLLSYRQGTSNDVPKKYADEAQSELEKALAATKRNDRS